MELTRADHVRTLNQMLEAAKLRHDRFKRNPGTARPSEIAMTLAGLQQDVDALTFALHVINTHNVIDMPERRS